MEGLLFFVGALALLLIVLVLVSVRRAHIRVEYSVSWLIAAVALFALSLSHGLLTRIAAALGMDAPPLALLTLVGCVFLLVLFRLSVIISHLKDSNIAVVQRVAILEYRLKSLHEEDPANH